MSRDQGVNLRPTLALLGMGHSSDWTGQITDDGKEAQRGQRVSLSNCGNHPGAGEPGGPQAETAGSPGQHRSGRLSGGDTAEASLPAPALGLSVTVAVRWG